MHNYVLQVADMVSCVVFDHERPSQHLTITPRQVVKVYMTRNFLLAHFQELSKFSTLFKILGYAN